MPDTEKQLHEFLDTAAAIWFTLNVQTATFMIDWMLRNSVSVAGLSVLSGVSERSLRRMLNYDANWTVSTMAKVFHAMGVRVSLINTAHLLKRK